MQDFILLFYSSIVRSRQGKDGISIEIYFLVEVSMTEQ